MKKFPVFVCLPFLLLGYEVAVACSCAPSGSPAEELKKARAVFTGEAVRVREPRPTPVRNKRGRVVAYQVSLMADVRFKVTRVWKGDVKGTRTVETMTGCCACGYGFVEGEHYLVYAFGDGEGGLVATICSRTRKLEDASEDLAVLGEGKAPGKRATPPRRRRAFRPAKPNNALNPAPFRRAA